MEAEEKEVEGEEKDKPEEGQLPNKEIEPPDFNIEKFKKI